MAKLLAINSDSETCECCGKNGLKRVMWIETENSGIMAYGVCCGAKALGLTGNYTTIEQVQKSIETQAKLALAKKEAQNSADKFNQVVAVCKKDGEYYTVRERAYNQKLHGFPVCWIEPTKEN